MYPFKSRYLRLLISLIDRFGYRFFPRKKTSCPDFKTILVIRLDQIGDIVMSQPFITALKKNRPETKITLLTTPAGKELLGQLPDIDEFIIFDPGAVEKPVSQRRFLALRHEWLRAWNDTLRAFFSLVRCLKRIPVDVIVDLRGDFRHILAARIAQPRAWLLSYGTTGGGFLLDGVAPDSIEIEQQKKHAVQRNLDLLPYLRVQIPAGACPRPRSGAGMTKIAGMTSNLLSSKISSAPLDSEIIGSLPQKKEKWIALHMGAKTAAKLWPVSHWKELLAQLMAEKNLHFFVIGDRESHQIFQQLSSQMESNYADRITPLCEKLRLSQVGTFLRLCDLFISVDSGPVHIAAAHSVKTMVLFSGTTEPEIWRPWSSQAMVLNHHVNCSPCHEKVCPKERHFCMEGLTPHDVFECFKGFQPLPSSGA